MAKDYRYERGLVGKWNGTDVWIMEAKDYDPHTNCISVIADEGMKMIRGGIVIGVLNANGNVNQFNKDAQRPYREKKQEQPKPQPQVVKGAAVEEIELTTTIPADYFNQFTSNVDEFFKTLGQ